MSTCEQSRPAPLRCPTTREFLESVLALLPRGRAWQSNEGGPLAGLVRAFDPGVFDDPPFQTRSRTQSVLMGFWRSIAQVGTFINQRFCDLRLEFWCATQTETRDLWMAEYGLPDSCDPFPDLCTKVAAIGGTRCEYYAALAARAGWSIECETLAQSDCGDSAGELVAGCGFPGGRANGGVIRIVVNLHESPAYAGAFEALPYAGNFGAGDTLACDPDISPLKCILDRVVHAHIAIVYEVNEGI
jgi:hypothetical protein